MIFSLSDSVETELAQLGSEKLIYRRRELNTHTLLSANVIYREDDLKGPEAVSFKAWARAVFDNNSEGIEDGILRYVKL